MTFVFERHERSGVEMESVLDSMSVWTQLANFKDAEFHVAGRRYMEMGPAKGAAWLPYEFITRYCHGTTSFLKTLGFKNSNHQDRNSRSAGPWVVKTMHHEKHPIIIKLVGQIDAHLCIMRAIKSQMAFLSDADKERLYCDNTALAVATAAYQNGFERGMKSFLTGDTPKQDSVTDDGSNNLLGEC